MRLVLDTNVVVSAVIWGGMPYRLLQAATDGDIGLYTSPALLAARADLIVSGDKHLLDLGGSYQSIRIATPAGAVQLIGR